MTDLVFVNWAFKIVEHMNKLNGAPLDEKIKELSEALEADFNSLYDIAVKEDDDYVHVDDAYDYVADNFEPMEWDR